jgi:hypothetical protein
MAIVKNIVDSHNGTIDVVSQKMVGTTVTVALPKYWQDMHRRVAQTSRLSSGHAPERNPAPEHTNATLPGTSNCHLGIPPVPDMDRRPKEKSDPGKVALM